MGQQNSHQFEVIQTLTDPRYGRINLINYNQSILALKSITFYNPSQYSKFKSTLNSIKHPNLLEIHHLSVQETNMPQLCDTTVTAYAALEYVTNSLNDSPSLQEHQIYRMFSSLIDLLAFLQGNNISTSNLNPQQLSLTSSLQLKLNPVSVLLENNKQDPARYSTNPYKNSVYNLGLTMLLTCLKQQNFQGEISSKHPISLYVESIQQNYSPQLTTLIKQMLTEQEDSRPDFQQLLPDYEQVISNKPMAACALPDFQEDQLRESSAVFKQSRMIFQDQQKASQLVGNQPIQQQSQTQNDKQKDEIKQLLKQCLIEILNDKESLQSRSQQPLQVNRQRNENLTQILNQAVQLGNEQPSQYQQQQQQWQQQQQYNQQQQQYNQQSWDEIRQVNQPNPQFNQSNLFNRMANSEQATQYQRISDGLINLASQKKDYLQGLQQNEEFKSMNKTNQQILELLEQLTSQQIDQIQKLKQQRPNKETNFQEFNQSIKLNDYDYTQDPQWMKVKDDQLLDQNYQLLMRGPEYYLNSQKSTKPNEFQSLNSKMDLNQKIDQNLQNIISQQIHQNQQNVAAFNIQDQEQLLNNNLDNPLKISSQQRFFTDNPLTSQNQFANQMKQSNESIQQKFFQSEYNYSPIKQLNTYNLDQNNNLAAKERQQDYSTLDFVNEKLRNPLRKTFQNGSYYEGQLQNGVMHGEGKLCLPDDRVAYEGQWQQGDFHGYGTLYNDNPEQIKKNFTMKNFNLLEKQNIINYAIDSGWIKYEGEFRNDKKNGMGSLTLCNGDVFEGEFQNDFIHGQGIYHKLNGQSFKGQWRKNKMIN